MKTLDARPAGPSRRGHDDARLVLADRPRRWRDLRLHRSRPDAELRRDRLRARERAHGLRGALGLGPVGRCAGRRGRADLGPDHRDRHPRRPLGQRRGRGLAGELGRHGPARADAARRHRPDPARAARLRRRGPLARPCAGQTVGRTFQATCDAALGDARCGVDLEDPGLQGHGRRDRSPARPGLHRLGARRLRGRLVHLRHARMDERRERGAAHRGAGPRRHGRHRDADPARSAGARDRRGRRLHHPRGLRQADGDLRGEVRQHRQLPRLPAHPRPGRGPALRHEGRRPRGGVL
jgi:hypothetical protein